MTVLASMRLMHYQAQPLDLDRTRSYTQRPQSTFAKPVGFWVSVEGADDWPTWCRGEEFAIERLTVAHEVRLVPDANVRIVTSTEEFDDFHQEFAAPSDFDLRHGNDRSAWGIDWQAVTRRCAGIIITPYLWQRRFGPSGDWYYGWDCASGCIWDLSAVESVTALQAVAE